MAILTFNLADTNIPFATLSLSGTYAGSWSYASLGWRRPVGHEGVPSACSCRISEGRDPLCRHLLTRYKSNAASFVEGTRSWGIGGICCWVYSFTVRKWPHWPAQNGRETRQRRTAGRGILEAFHVPLLPTGQTLRSASGGPIGGRLSLKSLNTYQSRYSAGLCMGHIYVDRG